MLRALDHLVLTVRDLERSIRFYTEVLGMQHITFGEGRHALRMGAQKINLHLAGREHAPHAQRPTPGSADLCLLLNRPGSELEARLTAHQIPVEEGPVARTGATGPIRSWYLRDPDGNLLELAEAMPAPVPASQGLPRTLPDGCVLDHATAADAAGCAAIYRPIVEQTHSSFEEVAPDAAAFQERIAASQEAHAWLVIRDPHDEVLAYAYTTPHRARAAYAIACESSVYCAPQAQRRGFARLLTDELLAHAAATGRRKVYAIITLPNETSIAFHESMGYRALAHFPAAGRKFDRFWDVGWWMRELA